MDKVKQWDGNKCNWRRWDWVTCHVGCKIQEVQMPRAGQSFCDDSTILVGNSATPILYHNAETFFIKAFTGEKPVDDPRYILNIFYSSLIGTPFMMQLSSMVPTPRDGDKVEFLR